MLTWFPKRSRHEHGWQLCSKVVRLCAVRDLAQVDTFVGRFRCIPALTANLTMEGFQRATQC